jgi:hypothetical protein
MSLAVLHPGFRCRSFLRIYLSVLSVLPLAHKSGQSAELKKSYDQGHPGRTTDRPPVPCSRTRCQSSSAEGQSGQRGLRDWQESHGYYDSQLRMKTEAAADPSRAVQCLVTFPKMRGSTKCREALTPDVGIRREGLPAHPATAVVCRYKGELTRRQENRSGSCESSRSLRRRGLPSQM